jgi:hypothetical protein
MSEPIFKLDYDGQAVNRDELNTFGSIAGLADDRVFAEILRMTPDDGTVYRGILPYAGEVRAANYGVAIPNGASGSVLVNPFRAVVGSRSLVGSGGLANWRDIRSAICIGNTSLTQVVSFTANSSGNPRWDLIYAAVAIDANTTPVTRKVKDPTTSVVTEESVSVFAQTTVTLGVNPGTPASTPTFPAAPSDSGSTYYIPIAYVRVVNGFGGSTTLNSRDIYEVAPALAISRALGAGSLRPADQQNILTGTAITGSGTSAVTLNGDMKWKGTTDTRPAGYMPPSMVGSESLLIAIDLSSGSSGNWSHQNLAIIDASRDWKWRLFKWAAMVAPTTLGVFPWNASSVDMFASTGMAPGYASSSSALIVGTGSSFHGNGGGNWIFNAQASGAGSTATPAAGFNVPTNAMTSGAAVRIDCDTTTGNLQLHITGTPTCSILLWLEASAPYPNAFF